MSDLISTDELLQLFPNLGKDGRYECVTRLKGRYTGFSVQRPYPSNCRFKPPVTKGGKPDVVALIHVVSQRNGDAAPPPQTDGRRPIWIEIAAYSRWREDHFDYDFEDKECPTRESVERSSTTPRPVGLEYADTFFLSCDAGRFSDGQGVAVEPLGMLDRVFDEHCDTVHLVKGLPLRLSRKVRSLRWRCLTWSIKFLRGVLHHGFGRTLDDSSGAVAIFEGYTREAMKKLVTDSLSIFDYKASKSVVILFCLLAFTLCLAKYVLCWRCRYIEAISSNGFLVVTHAILGLWLLDTVVPEVLFRVVNRLIRWRTATQIPTYEKR